MTSLPTSSPSLEGEIVGGKYRVAEMIGSGGMGTVWSGQHTALGTHVAIKFIRPQYATMEDARQRFEIEALAAAKLTTVHAVKVFDYGMTEDGLPYIVMEYLEGLSLSDALIKDGPMPAPEVAKIIGQAALALSKAHAAGVVHRDLKPDNIFLAANVENPRGGELPFTVKLVDFGIAKMFEAPRVAGLATPPAMGGPTQEGAVIGTPNFMAPEQLTLGGAPGPLTDLWSLGACAFAAMTARIPFEGDVLGDIVIKVCASPLPVPSQLIENPPTGFDGWFARACSRDPSKRFQSALELAESLSNVCGTGRVRMHSADGEQVQYMLRKTSPMESIPVPPAGMSPRTALLAGLVLGIAVMVGLAGALAFREKEQAYETKVSNHAATASAAAAATDAGPPDAPEADTFRIGSGQKLYARIAPHRPASPRIAALVAHVGNPPARVPVYPGTWGDLPCRSPVREYARSRGLRCDAPFQLHAHQVEARGVEPARLPVQEQRMVPFRVVGRFRRSTELVPMRGQREGRAELVSFRCIKVSESLLQ